MDPKKFPPMAFQPRADWEIETTLPESPLRRFAVRCINCRSVLLRFIGEYSDDAGGTRVYLFCTRCRAREEVKML